MINIFGLRGKAQVHFGTAPSVGELLHNPDKYVELVPENERFNLYFTVYNCNDHDRNNFKFQQFLPIDIDHVPAEIREKVVDITCLTLGVARNTIGILCSGYGLQFFIQLPDPLNKLEEFDVFRPFYKALVERLQDALIANGIPNTVKVDPTGFAKKKLMRMPNTLNVKEGRPDAKSYMINGHIEQSTLNIVKLSGLPEIRDHEQISVKALKKIPVDEKAVLEGCEFLKHCKANQAQVDEPQWYAMLSITARLPEGVQISHEYSNEHPKYSKEVTSNKIEQAIAASGPRTCENVNLLWGKCNMCRHWRQVTSPIMIQGPDFIGTKDTGFYTVNFDASGKETGRKPNYEDLARYFEKLHPFVNRDVGGKCVTYIYNGTHWVDFSPAKLKSFAEENFNPKPSETMRNEFASKILIRNIVAEGWFEATTEKKVNMRNGVFDMVTKQLLPHSPDFGFKNVLNFDYNPNATAPTFDKFLDDVTVSDDAMKQTLLEYAGYCISGDRNWAQQALFLTGHGKNGKSTFVEVLQEISGDSAYSSIDLSSLDDPAMRQNLENKLFNICEETNPGSLAKSESFKRLVTGEKVTVKRLYLQPYTTSLQVKLLITCNTLPKVRDTSDGTTRRMMIVPFDAQFTVQNRDPFMKEKLIKEASGIFNMLVIAYQSLLDRKDKRIFTHEDSYFTQSSRSFELLEDFKEETNDLEHWFKTHIAEFEGHRLPYMDCYLALQNYLERYKIKLQITKPEFSAYMAKNGHKTTVAKVNGQTVRVYKNIRLSEVATK